MPTTSYMCRIGKHDNCLGKANVNMHPVDCACECHPVVEVAD